MYTAKKLRRLLFLLLPIAICVVAVAGSPRLVHWWNEEKEANADKETGRKDGAQQAIIDELMAWLQPFDSTNTCYYMNGLLTAIDKADSANALHNVPYTVCKLDNALYLRVGQTETVNDEGLYCFVDHSVKRIMIGKARKLVYQNNLPGGDLYKFVRDEGYTFTKTNNEAGLWTISMQNPNHISRKEFSVRYDSVSRQVKRLFVRQAEFVDPMNPDMEKWITLDIREWDDEPEAGKFINVKKFVEKKQGDWVCVPAYREYDLIIL